MPLLRSEKKVKRLCKKVRNFAHIHRGKGHLWKAVQSYQLTVPQCQLPGHPERAAQERQHHTRDWNGCPYSNKTYTSTCNQHMWNSHPMQPHAPHIATPWHAHALTQLVSQVIINAICVHTTKWQYYSTQKKSYLGAGEDGRGNSPSFESIPPHLNLSFAWRCVMHARQLIPRPLLCHATIYLLLNCLLNETLTITTDPAGVSNTHCVF